MFRIAIRYMGREKDDVLSATITHEEASRVRADLADTAAKPPESSKAFIVVEAEDKKIMIVRRDTLVSVTIWEERDR